MKKMTGPWKRLSGMLLLMLWFPLSATAAQLPEWQQTLLRMTGARDAVMVCGPNGRVIFARNEQHPRIPASTLKLLTALVARHCLGEGWRFFTECALDARQNLHIKGYGDPLLISEVLPDMAGQLSRHISRYRDLVLDDAWFDTVTIPGITSSLNPYDAPNGALCVNFNTIHFRTAGGRYVSGEPQTPLIDAFADRIRGSGLSRGRIVLSAEQAEITRYAGHLMAHFFAAAGIVSSGNIRLAGSHEPRGDLLMRYLSPYSLDGVIEKLMHYSNNFIANQLLIASGIARSGPPGTLEKGLAAAREYAGTRLELKRLVLAEGSGISRENRITAAEMMTIVSAFEPWADLLKQEGRVRYKTGSLTGVKCRVGFIPASGGGFYKFVILLNTPGKVTEPLFRILVNGLT